MATPTSIRIGSLETFDVAAGNWASYSARLTQFLTANNITDPDQQKATMLTVIGGPAFDLLRDLLAPDEPSSKTFDELKEVLGKHLMPKPLVIGERYRFYQRDQRQGEAIVDYVAELRRRSRTCDFQTHLAEALRDRFVCGLRSSATRKKLLVMSKLTFEEAVITAKADELAVRDAEEVSGVTNNSPRITDAPVHKVKTRKMNSSTQMAHNSAPLKPCFRCGGEHSPADCRFKDAECRACGKKGHIQKVCRSKKTTCAPTSKTLPPRKQQQPVHQVQRSNESAALFSSDEEMICAVSAKTRTPAPFTASPVVNGVKIQMEIDTGAAVSILPSSQYKKHFSSLPLSPCTLSLSTYSGERLRADGVLKVDVAINNQRSTVDLYVVDTPGPALFGRAWLEVFTLDWQGIRSVIAQTPTMKSALEDLRKRYKEVFGDQLGCLAEVKAKLCLKPGAQPKFVKARTIPLALRPKVEAEIKRMEQAGILTRVNWSDWATPVVPVVKPNGKVRLCGDFKVTVNPQLQIDQHPLPVIEEIFASLSGGQRFSKLDLKAAYTQMEMDESSKPLLTLNTHLGLYRLNRLAYGVASAPALWQRAMDSVLAGVPKMKCIIDDIIVTGKDDAEHLSNLEEVLQRLAKSGLRLNLEKCAFFQERVEYCGHAVSSEGLHTLPSKMDAIGSAPPPEDVSQVRSFLGLVTYYQRFIPDMASILQPISELLEHSRKFKWTGQCQHSFDRVKQVLASSEVLMHYDPTLPLRLASDASPYGLGAVLSHVLPGGQERPIAYASRKLSKAERAYSQIDKEALGIVWSVKKFHNYLYGHEFELLTDHQPLVSIFSPAKGLPTMTAARLQRYAMFLAGHQYKIVYRSTKNHSNADCLSRLPLSETVSHDAGEEAVEIFYTSLMDHLPVTADQIGTSTRRDPILATVLQYVQSGWPDN